MPHLTDDELVLHYYGELDTHDAARAGSHLGECAVCHANLTKLQRVLAAVDAAPAPDVADGFERTVWARLQPDLARRRGWSSWLVAPTRLAWVAAVVVLIGAAFFAGRLSQHRGIASPPPNALATSELRERVLLTALGEHLDRSQMMLVDLISAADGDDLDVVAQRARAEQLASANRLYRQTATATGNMGLAQVLEDLEQVLVDIAASPDHVSAEDIKAMRQRIDDRGLLLKVRVLSSEVQKRQRREIRTRAGQSS